MSQDFLSFQNVGTLANWAAVFISCLALGFTLWQGSQIRKHQRLSVKPHLSAQRTTDNEKKIFSITLINNGVGPAIIKGLHVELDGEPVVDEAPLAKVMHILFEDFDATLKSTSLHKEYCMASKEGIPLFEISFSPKDGPSKEQFVERAGRVDLSVNYESLYGERFVFSSKETN